MPMNAMAGTHKTNWPFYKDVQKKLMVFKIWKKSKMSLIEKELRSTQELNHKQFNDSLGW